MKGWDLKVRAYVKEYGSDFVIDVLDKAVERREAEEMSIRRLSLDSTDKRKNVLRITQMAKDMGVRLG